ncbi:MAG: response regulator transcription factor [Myxococcota bacterium]
MDAILIVDPDAAAEKLAEAFRDAGFRVEQVDGADLRSRIREPAALAVLSMDLLVPRATDLLRAIRSSPVNAAIPVIATSASRSEIDRVLAFELGADDFVPKPLSIREMVLRVQAVLRRCRRRSELVPQRLSLGPVEIDPQHGEVTVDGNPVHLTTVELRLLVDLVTRKGRVQRRQELIDRVWPEADPGPRTVDTHVRRLREKLGPAADLIETVRGVGYRVPRDEERDEELHLAKVV